jgi:hypothetical protein
VNEQSTTSHDSVKHTSKHTLTFRLNPVMLDCYWLMVLSRLYFLHFNLQVIK